MDQVFTTHDIGRLLQVDASTVAKWIDRGMLNAYRTPGGHRRVRSGDLKSFLILHEMPVPMELGPTPVKLLIADDEKPTLETLRRAFRKYNDAVEIQTTTSGVEAVLMVAEQKPHGLLIDLNMPEIDGLEVCRRIHARKGLQSVRLVTMTARHTPDMVEASLKAGAMACLAKPFEVEDVLQLFKTSIQMAQKAGS